MRARENVSGHERRRAYCAIIGQRRAAPRSARALVTARQARIAYPQEVPYLVAACVRIRRVADQRRKRGESRI